MQSRRDEARDVGHVDDEVRAVFGGDLAHGLEVDHARIGAGCRQRGPWAFLADQIADLIVVQAMGFRMKPVAHDLEELAREIDGASVSEVAAVRKTHADHRVARIHERHVGGHIGLRAGVRLDVRGFAPKSLVMRSMARLSTWSTNSQPP